MTRFIYNLTRHEQVRASIIFLHFRLTNLTCRPALIRHLHRNMSQNSAMSQSVSWPNDNRLTTGTNITICYLTEVVNPTVEGKFCLMVYVICQSLAATWVRPSYVPDCILASAKQYDFFPTNSYKHFQQIYHSSSLIPAYNILFEQI